MTTESPARTIEKKITLSVEADAFLQSVKRQRKLPSDSEVLEILLHEFMEAERRRAIDAEYTEFYNSVSGEYLAEEREWGEFAQAAFVEVLSPGKVD